MTRTMLCCFNVLEACCTVLNTARGSEAGCVCSSVCLYSAFHVPHISLPFISPPPLCRFGGGVQSASRISFQLVLVQILILKGGLTSLASEKTRGRKRREGEEEKDSCRGDAPLHLFTLQLMCWIVLWKGRKSQVCRPQSNRPPLIQTQELTGFIIQ